MPDIVKSNLMELNRTQSVDWVRLSSAIERNRTPDFQWVRFPNKSNSSHKSNSIEHNLMDWVRLALVNLYKASPKQAHQSRFTIYSTTETPFINCPRQLREQNRTKLSLFPRANSEIVVPFPFLANLQLRTDKTRVTFMQKYKQITNRNTGNGIQ